MEIEIIHLIEVARQAQQENEQKHDVQLEIPDSVDRSFIQRRQEQIEFETGRDPRD